MKSILFIGNSGTGKSTIIESLRKNKFSDDIEYQTLGISKKYFSDTYENSIKLSYMVIFLLM